MTRPAVRYTIERAVAPDERTRHLAVNDKGQLVWSESFVQANHFPTRRAAQDMIDHRLAGSTKAPRVVPHTVH